jgi:hypothetical protein
MMGIALTLSPLAIKYADILIMAAIHKAYQEVDGMTDEELTAAIAVKEAAAERHDDWIAEKLAKAKAEGR